MQKNLLYIVIYFNVKNCYILLYILMQKTGIYFNVKNVIYCYIF